MVPVPLTSVPKTLFRLLLPSLLLLLMLAVLLPYSDRVMYCDEANTLYQYAIDPIRALLSYVTPNNHILHSLLIWAMTSLAGTSSLVVRFAALAGALISMALAYRVAARLTTGANTARRNAGLLAAAFLGTAYGVADYAINARGYTLAIALTLALIDLVFATPRKRFMLRRYQYSVMLVCAALVLTLPSMILASGAIGLWVLFQQRTYRRYRWVLVSMIVGTLIGVIFYLPAGLAGLIGSHLGMFGETDLRAMLDGWAQLIFSTTTIPWVGMIFALALVAGVIYAIIHRQWGVLWVVALLIGVATAAVLTQYTVSGRTLFARNYVYLVAPLAVLAGIGGAGVLRRIAPVAAFLLVILSMPSLQALDGTYMEKSVIEQIDRNVTHTDWLIAGPCLNAPVLHYLSEAGRAELLYARSGINRVILLTREGTPEENLAYFNAVESVNTCLPISGEAWAPTVTTYTCSLR